MRPQYIQALRQPAQQYKAAQGSEDTHMHKAAHGCFVLQAQDIAFAHQNARVSECRAFTQGQSILDCHMRQASHVAHRGP